MISFIPMSSLEMTNQCVVLCDLSAWNGPESPAWQLFNGNQDDVGRSIATILNDKDVHRIDDFGGVCKTFLCDGDVYRQAPPRIEGNAAVFSFTPKKRLAADGLEMARVSNAAGYRLLILTPQKEGKIGKVWVLCGILRHLTGGMITYYEDTNTVVDELKKSKEAKKVIAIHVQAPGYEHCAARLADRVVSQVQYQKEVLEAL